MKPVKEYKSKMVKHGKIMFALVLVYIFSIGTYFTINDLYSRGEVRGRGRSPEIVNYTGPMYLILGFTIILFALIVYLMERRSNK